MDGMVPATVAVLVVIADAAPEVTVGTELTPEPTAATLIEEAPPPPTGIFQLYDCTNVGVNCTNTCCEYAPPGCVKLSVVV